VSSILEAALPSPAQDRDRWGQVVAIAADFSVVAASMVLAHAPLAIDNLEQPDVSMAARKMWADLTARDLGVVLLYGALVTLLSHSEGLFHPAEQRSRRFELTLLFKSVGWATGLMIIANRLSGGGTVTSTMLASAGVLIVAGLYARRTLGSRIRGRPSSGNGRLRNILIVGAGRVGREIAQHLLTTPEMRRAVKGFLDRSPGMDVLGRVEDLAHIARSEFVDEVIVAAPHDPELGRAAVAQALRNHLDVRVVPDLFGYVPERAGVERIGDAPLVSLHEEPIPEFGLLLKRVLDVGLSIAGLCLASPFMAFIAVLVKLDSPGPVLYRAQRAGRKGERFLCCKFRTMTVDADRKQEQLRRHNERQGPTFKISDDPRITHVGRWLRRYSLDELPQLWNVLKGEMSLVGPRPHPLHDVDRYELEHLRRLDVTPGITGLWQVTARRDPSFQKNMVLDLEYIERWSLWLDFRILLKTLGAVVAGTGA
jgi:exopolysaccharide biosynthesis polyprenyl glycosylphosphotransferase